MLNSTELMELLKGKSLVFGNFDIRGLMTSIKKELLNQFLIKLDVENFQFIQKIVRPCLIMEYPLE